MAKVYTKKGDFGCTMISSMNLPKDSPVIDTIGSIDELQSMLDICRLNLPEKHANAVEKIQDKLRFLAGEIAGYVSDEKMLITHDDVAHFEEIIDALSDVIPNQFVRFNTPAAVYLNEARVRTRALERKMVHLLKDELVREDVYQYVNRMSDLFFVWSYNFNE